MKRILTIISIGVFLTTTNVVRSEPLANANKSGLYARSIEEVLRLEPDEIDLGVAALIVSERWSDVVPGRKHLSQLDDMAQEIRNRMQAQRIGIGPRAIEVINKYLFDEIGFRSVKDANDANDLFLHNVLDKKRGYCLSLSVLYLAIGERLGLPLYGVVVPGHFFVRYDDGRVRFNIEPTSKGGYATDESYISKFKVPRGNIGSTIYMKNLNKLQSLGCFFNNLGNIYNESGDTETAMAVLEKAVEINPSAADCRTNLGNIYLKKNRMEDALRQYRLATEINPWDATVHGNLGNAYAQQEQFTNAISEYTRAVELDPNFTESYKRIGLAYSKLGRFGSAKMYLRDAISLRPKDAECYKLMGDVYSQEGNCREALYQYKKALGLQRNYAEAYFNMAMCYNKLGEIDSEIGAYKKALEYKSDMTAALLNLGNAYMSQKNYDAAIELYKKALRQEPSEGLTYYNLGVAYSYKEDFERAAEQYRNAIEIEPKMADAHNNLAIVYYRLKKYGLAMEHIKKAEQLGAKINRDLLEAIESRLK